MTDPSNTSNNVAMNLWQKFSDLQSAAESCRKQRAASNAKLASLRKAMEHLTEVSKREQEQIVQAEMKTSAFRRLIHPLEDEDEEDDASNQEANVEPASLTQDSVQQENNDDIMTTTDGPTLSKQLEAVENDYMEAVRAHEIAQRQLDNWKQWKVDQLESTRLQSKDFQSNAQNYKLQALSLGILDAHIVAGIESAVAVGVLDETQRFPSSMEPFANQTTDRTNSNSNDDDTDPLTWIIPQSDIELQDAVEKYKTQFDSHAQVAKELESWRAKQTKLNQKYQRRVDRAQQLELQLQRLSRDTEEIRGEILQLQQLTEEDTVLARTYQKKIDDRRQSRQGGRTSGLSQQPSQPVTNPYHNHKRKANAPPNPLPPSSLVDIVLGRRTRHRGNQFGGSSLQVSSPEPESTNATNTASVTPPAIHETADLEEEEDDDDDDALLNYVGLAK